MGLRAACFESLGGVPADEPPHLTVGGERAPLPRMRPSPRPEPLWRGGVYVTSVPARPCRCAGRAKRGRLPGLTWGGLPLSLHSPHPAAWGWWVGWLVARMQAPRGGALPMSRLNTGVPPAPGTGQSRALWCVSWCAGHADALRVAVVRPAATVSHSPVCQCACWTCVSVRMLDRGVSHAAHRPRPWSAASGFPFYGPIPGRWWRENGCC